MLALSDQTKAVFSPLIFPVAEHNHIRLEYDSEHNVFLVDGYEEIENWTGSVIRNTPCVAIRTIIKRLKDCKPNTQTKQSSYGWKCAATDINVEILHELAGSGTIVFADEQSRIYFASILMRSRAADLCAQNLATYDADKTLPDNVYDCEISGEKPLSCYQLLPLANLMTLDGYGLFMEMGTGKTPVVIARICNAIRVEKERCLQTGDTYVHRRIVIMCPINACGNWRKEIAEFATRRIRVTILRGTAIDRLKGLIDIFQADGEIDASVAIIGYDTLVQEWKNNAGFRAVPWDIAVADEAHLFKGPKTKRFEAMMKLRDMSAQRISLTGTPIANSVVDLYAQFEFMGKGYSGFNSFSAFKSFYCQFEETSGGHQTMVGVQNMPFMKERLARYSYTITKAVALPNMPSKVNDIYECEMSERQADFYDDLRKNLMVQIEAELNSGKPKAMVANCILTQLLRLAQITSGFLTWGAEYDEITGDVVNAKQIEFLYPNPKLAGLCELLADKPATSKTLIWTCFTPDIVQISDMLVYNGIDHVVFNGQTSQKDRELAEYRFNNDDNCKVFLGNSLAGGAALNLLGFPPNDPSASECNADHTIYYSQNWSRTSRAQSGDRNYRRGTRVQIRETDLVIPRTIDEEIRARVVQKTVTAMEIGDIQEILKTLSVKL